MTPPTQKVREMTYRRDGNRCVSCGSASLLEWQHRQATGMGGRGKRAPKLTPADGLTLCKTCNQLCEGDADFQRRAIANGWKVRKFSPVPCNEVPVWYRAEFAWFLINVDGSRDELTENIAAEYRALAGTIGGEVSAMVQGR